MCSQYYLERIYTKNSLSDVSGALFRGHLFSDLSMAPKGSELFVKEMFKYP